MANNIHVSFDEGDDNAAFYLRVNLTEKLLKTTCNFLLLQTMFELEFWDIIIMHDRCPVFQFD